MRRDRSIHTAWIDAIVLTAVMLGGGTALAAGGETPAWTWPAAWLAPPEERPPWPDVRAEARPGSYWWWPGSAVTRGDLSWNLETYHQAGWGSLGVIGIYGVKGAEERSIPIFSPEWFAMFNHAAAEARRLGMNLDLTPSSGWRLGGPHITAEHGEMAFVVKNGGIDARPVRSMVKRGGPGGKGRAVNPYSPAAVKFHFDWLDERMRESAAVAPRAFYYDSFENTGNWAPELPDRFRKWRGYDLMEHAAALGGEGDPEVVRRVVCDYRETLSQLLLECVDDIVRWSAGHGSLLRMQAHGAPANLLDMYAAAGIPETEVFGSNHFDIPGYRRDPRWSKDEPHSELVHRFASSAAHVAGRELVISESFTWLRNHFHTTLAHLKAEADRLLLCGVNGIHYHGSCFAPEETEWPGWLFYASSQINPRNSIFRDIPALNDYLTRCQGMLQLGRPHHDVLIYWPVHDLWMGGGGREIFFKVHDSSWIEGTPCGELANQLARLGHSFDFISDRQIAQVRHDAGALVTSGGNPYRTILVPDARHMPLETLRQLLALAEAGATVGFWKNLPHDVPGLHDHAARGQEMRALLATLEFQQGVATVGRGKILRLEDPAALAGQAGVEREKMADRGLRFIRRKLPGEVVYFIANLTGEPVDGWVPVASPCRAARIMDPMTGRHGRATTRGGETSAEIHLQLLPGESRILRVHSDREIDAPPWPEIRPAGDAIAIDGPWQLRFIEGGPALPAPAAMERLACWTTLESPEAGRFAGAAAYATTITLPGEVADRWWLDLGDVRESARVRINGQPAGVVFAHPFRLEIAGLLKPGENQLEIEVTNLSANRIRDLDKRGVPWKKFHDINFVDHHYQPFDASDWPLKPSGLLGPLRLIPLAK